MQPVDIMALGIAQFMLVLTVRPRAELRRAASALEGVPFVASVGRPKRSPGFKITCDSLRPNSDESCGSAAWNEATLAAGSAAAAGATTGAVAAAAAYTAKIKIKRFRSSCIRDSIP